MVLTNKQEQALKLAVSRYRSNEPYTVISGYAGSGKSTTIKFIISALNVAPERVAYAAYTGKAAQVLQNKGNPDAMTTHRLLYKSFPRADGTFVHLPRTDLRDLYDVIVIDEVSMLPKQMWDLLLSHGIYVIACGDPEQLPPIGEENGILDHPHIFLDEIMRQALESEIVRLSMDVREGKRLFPHKGTEVNIVPYSGLCDGMLTWADQIICGKNATRFEMNDYYRRMKFGKDISQLPVVGDKVICLKNDWDAVNGVGDALVNGTIGEISGIGTEYDRLRNFTLGRMDFLPETANGNLKALFNFLPIDWKLITEHLPTVTKENYYKFKRVKLEQFDYGYCITVWKAQGGEYEKVLFCAEPVGKMDNGMYRRYLYTGITRASKKLTLCI